MSTIVSPKSSPRKKEKKESLLVPNPKPTTPIAGIRKIMYED